MAENTTKQTQQTVRKNTKQKDTTMSKETTAKTTETATETAAKSRLPNKIYFRGDDDSVQAAEVEKVIGVIIENGELSDTEDFKASEIAKNLLMNNLRSQPNMAEIPPQFEDIADDLEKANELANQIATVHITCKSEVEEQQKLAKQAKAEEKEKAAAEKKAKEQEYQKNEEKFGDTFMKSLNKAVKAQENFVENLTSAIKLPKSISFTSNGMGIAVSKDATKDDIASALAQSVTTFGSLESAKNAIQFQMGDALNKAVELGVYPKKSTGASHLRHVLIDKCGKNWKIEHIQACALAAERIPAEKRVKGVNFSNYLAISKLTPPRIKGASNDASEAKAEEIRAELVEKVNSGELNSKSLKEAIDQKKIEAGFAEKKNDDSGRIAELKNILFYTQFMISIAIKDEVKVKRSKDTHTYTVEELQGMYDEAQAELVQLVIAPNYDIDALGRGLMEVDKKGKKEEVGYRMADPFWSKSKETEKKEEEPEQVPTTPVESEEDEDEDEDEGVQF